MTIVGGGGGRSGNCFKCQESGHMARDCPNSDSKGIIIMYLQGTRSYDLENW